MYKQIESYCFVVSGVSLFKSPAVVCTRGLNSKMSAKVMNRHFKLQINHKKAIYISFSHCEYNLKDILGRNNRFQKTCNLFLEYVSQQIGLRQNQLVNAQSLCSDRFNSRRSYEPKD